MASEVHVLHVVGAMNIGGIENMLMTLMPHMRKKGIIFDFAVHGKAIGVHETKIKELGGRIYHLPKFAGINVFTYLSAWRKLLANHPELKVIHGHMTSTASMYLLLAKKYGRVTIAHSHSTSTSGGKIVYGIKSMLEYPLRYISDYLCACSAAAANYRFGEGTSERSNYFLWHNAIDVEKFRFSSEKRKLYRKKLGLGESTIVIGHVGRMIPAKNHNFLLEIFREYRKINLDSKLLLVGDGPLREVIEKNAKEKGLDSAMIFTGAVGNPADYLSVMDVFCFPSVYEGLPVSLIEAQINGLACVCADTISSEVKISDKTVFLPLKNDKTIWVNMLYNCFQGSRELKNDMYNPYDADNVSNDVRDYYRRILKEG